MQKKIDEFNKLKASLIEEMKLWCVDKSIPLEERWKVFIESDLAPIDRWYHHPDGVDWDKVELYNDFYCDRYQTMEASSFVELCQDKINDKEDFECDLDKVKEYFLSEFISGFIHDW